MGMNIRKIKHLPPIGLRIVKSAAAVFLCCCVDYWRSRDGLVFYSQLAALWCMQDYVKETRQNARQRTMGTIIGALYGLAALVLFPVFHGVPLPERAVQGVIISVMTALILYTTVVFNKKQASYFSCVVFLSIVVNHVSDANPYLFVWNRFLDTVIGTVIGVAVNSFRLPRERNRDILYISGLDDTLLTGDNELSGYTRVELNRMIDDGALFTISTMRTPASLMEPLKDIRLKLPVIAMDGAVLYDICEKRYLRSFVISHEHSRAVVSFLKAQGVQWFSNVIIDDVLVIYYQESDNEVYNNIVRTYSRSPYRNYVKRELPPGEDVVYFMLLDRKERIEAVYQAMEAHGLTAGLKALKYDSTDYPGCAYIKLYNHNATKNNMTDYLMETLQVEKKVTFGSIEGKYTYTILPGNASQVAKLMKKSYEPIKLPKGILQNGNNRIKPAADKDTKHLAHCPRK